MIKKIFIPFLLVLSILSCEDIPDNIIEPQTADYTIKDISAPDLMVFNENDNKISTSITIDNSESVEEVWFDISTEDGLEDISTNNIMSSESSGSLKVFSGESIIDESLLAGFYILSYYVKDGLSNSDENIKKVGTKKFEYRSETENFPPIISDLILPQEVDRGVNFIFSIKVDDLNGLSDIEMVFFKLKRPDGTIVYSDQENNVEEFPMFDNGDFNNAGDNVEGDGIYSLKNSFGSSSQTGDWLFEFGAIDNSGEFSNTISQNLKVN